MTTATVKFTKIDATHTEATLDGNTVTIRKHEGVRGWGKYSYHWDCKYRGYCCTLAEAKEEATKILEAK